MIDSLVDPFHVVPATPDLATVGGGCLGTADAVLLSFG